MHRLSDQQLIDIINQADEIPVDEAFKQLLLTELAKRNPAFADHIGTSAAGEHLKHAAGIR